MGWQNMLPGPVTVGQDVPQIASMIANRDQQNRQNKLADIAMRRQDMRWNQEQGDRQQEEKLRSAWARIQQAKGAPPEVQAQVIAQLSQEDPEFGAVFGRMPPEQAIQHAEAGIGAKLGERLPQPEKPAQSPASVQEYEYGLKNPAYNDWRQKSKGRGITIGPDGTVQIGGEYNPTELGKPTRGALEAAFISGQQNSVNLGAAIAKWKPEFSTYKGLATAKVSEMKERLNLADPADSQYLSDYSSWSSEVSNALSQYLNQLSGAAISPAEEQRLKAGFPNTDDSPSQYKAKTDATMRRFALVQARAGYMLSNPAIKLDSLSIEAMNNVIATEANKLQASYIKGGMNAEQARQKALADTRVRFGIGGQ